MRNNYLFFAVFMVMAAMSCQKVSRPDSHLPTCSGNPELVSQNSFPLEYPNDKLSFAQDKSGNIYTTGPYSGTINFGSITLSSGSYFLTKSDPAGNIIYAKSLGFPLVLASNLNADSLQNVYLCYLTVQEVSHLVINLAKYDSQGNLTWLKQIEFNMDVDLPAITVSNTGKVFMTVLNYSNPVDSAYWEGYGTLLYAFDSNGNLTAKKNLSNNKYDGAAYLAYSGSLYGVFNFASTDTAKFVKVNDDLEVVRSSTSPLIEQHIYFDNKLNIYLFDATSIKKIDTAFNTIWQIKAPAFSSMNTDNKGNLYIAGVFTGTVNFNTGSGTNNMTAKGSNDTYLEKIDATGNFVWAIQSLGVDKKDHTASLAVNSFTINSQGYIYVTGNAANTTSGNTDVFIAAYKQCNK